MGKWSPLAGRRHLAQTSACTHSSCGDCFAQCKEGGRGGSLAALSSAEFLSGNESCPQTARPPAAPALSAGQMCGLVSVILLGEWRGKGIFFHCCTCLGRASFLHLKGKGYINPWWFLQFIMGFLVYAGPPLQALGKLQQKTAARNASIYQAGINSRDVREGYTYKVVS